MYKRHSDFNPFMPVTFPQLQAIADEPVLKKDVLSSPVIIKSFDMFICKGNYYLRVISKDGCIGVAPCSERASYFHLILSQKLLPFFIGKDARDLEDLLDQVYVLDINYKIQGLAYWCCIAWLESAVLDMLGHMAGVSVTELVGTRLRDTVDMYVASGNRGTTPEEEIAVLQEKVDSIGAKAIKFKLGGRMSRNADSIAGRTEGLLHLARRHFGENMIIHADGNGSFDAAKGIEIGRICEEINAYFYEEPCPFDDLWDTKTVADALTIPLAFGEQETSLRRFAWIIEHDAATVIQPDLQYNGGFIRNIQVARMAAAAGKVVTPHVSGGFPAYNMLLFCACVPNIGHYHEHKGLKGAQDYSRADLKAKNGVINLPNGPGLGFDFSSVINDPSCRNVFTVK